MTRVGLFRFQLREQLRTGRSPDGVRPSRAPHVRKGIRKIGLEGLFDPDDRGAGGSKLVDAGIDSLAKFIAHRRQVAVRPDGCVKEVDKHVDDNQGGAGISGAHRKQLTKPCG
jgi:hypothetical protein